MSQLPKKKPISARIISRLISKFKTNKLSLANMATKEMKMLPNIATDFVESPSQNQFPEMQKNKAKHRNEESVKNLSLFCDQLETFLNRVRSNKSINFYTYDYPNILHNRFQCGLEELESTLMEVRDALTNINRLKTQHKLVKKETLATKNTVQRLRDDEVRRMEETVAQYEKPLFTRWESAKSNPDQLEEALMELLIDIKGKKLALDNLLKLITRKLTKSTDQLGLKLEKSNLAKEKSKIPCPQVFLPKVDKTTPIIPSLFPSTSIPTPRQITVSDSPKKNPLQRISSIQKRRSEGNSNFYPLIENASEESNQEDLNLVPSAVIKYEIENGGSSIGNQMIENFRTEMQSVLQTLFTDARIGEPTLLASDSNDSYISRESTERNGR